MAPIELPFVRVGSGEKKLFIVAVVHGDEVTGVFSIYQLLDYLREVSVHGEVGILSIVNTEGGSTMTSAASPTHGQPHRDQRQYAANEPIAGGWCS